MSTIKYGALTKFVSDHTKHTYLQPNTRLLLLKNATSLIGSTQVPQSTTDGSKDKNSATRIAVKNSETTDEASERKQTVLLYEITITGGYSAQQTYEVVLKFEILLNIWGRKVKNHKETQKEAKAHRGQWKER